jgi:putative endonuclease
MWYLYIIECQDNSYYTGVTEDLERRLKEHKRKGSHYTSYKPLKKLLYVEEYKNQLDAEKREAQIKRWSRDKKSTLIKGKYKAHNKADLNADKIVDMLDFAIFADNWLQSSVVCSPKTIH